MKSLKFLFLFAACTLLIAVSCEESELLMQQKAAVENSCNDCTANLPSFPVHEETQVTITNENEHLLTLPEDVFFVARKKATDNRRFAALSLAGAGVRCKCTSGSGCNPTKYDGQYSCVMTTGCSSCDLSTTTGIARNAKPEEIEIKGLVDYNKGISFLVDKKSGDMMQDQFVSTKEDAYGNAFEDLLTIERVQTGINNFYKEIYGDEIPSFIVNNESELPRGYVYVQVNIYGNIAAMPFPVDLVETQAKSFAYLSLAGGISCSCHAGSGCKKKSAGFGSVQYCDSGSCTDCELKDAKK